MLLLLPIVVLMGSQLPQDWKQHSGSGLPGNAIVVAVEPLRGGTHIVVDVSDESGRVVATRQEVNGDAPHVLGAVFAVTYLPPGDSGMTQVYTVGHDPFRTNLLVFIPCAVVLFVGLARVGARLWKLGSRWRSRNRTGPYRAGYGYTRE
ncbi:enoyl-CoA hydratase [Janibacter sp. HTCC2649]|nr:enoyl-CoA hydratase [Janibacter sp. HTCC2649]